MLIDARKIDDFKTERKDLLPPLPIIYRLVPILFYLSLVFVGVVGSASVWHARVASTRYQTVVQETSELQKKIDAAKAARSSLEKGIREATDLENWVLASMPLQPLVVGIIRSVVEGTTIVDLSLERDPETPSQLKLALTLNTESDKQIDETLKVIRELNYREFSPTQSMVKGNLEYRASLLWRKPDDKALTPEAREMEELEEPRE
jgi:hypothetical protein